MSALPVEEQPSGAVPADTGVGPWVRRARPESFTGRAAPAGHPAGTRRPAVHPLFPAKKWLLPDGDCIFPGGGRSFSGRPAPVDVRPARYGARPAPDTQPSGQQSARQSTQRAARPSADVQGSVRPLTSVPVLSGPVVAAPGRLRTAPEAATGRAMPRTGLAPAGRAAEAVSPHRLRLTRRGRIVLAVLAVLTVCGLFVAGASAAQASGPAAAHGAAGTARQVIVQPGDSLWSIARSAAPNADARAIVQEILQANRLNTASITAGQRLWVPRG